MLTRIVEFYPKTGEKIVGCIGHLHVQIKATGDDWRGIVVRMQKGMPIAFPASAPGYDSRLKKKVSYIVYQPVNMQALIGDINNQLPDFLLSWIKSHPEAKQTAMHMQRRNTPSKKKKAASVQPSNTRSKTQFQKQSFKKKEAGHEGQAKARDRKAPKG